MLGREEGEGDRLRREIAQKMNDALKGNISFLLPVFFPPISFGLPIRVWENV